MSNGSTKISFSDDVDVEEAAPVANGEGATKRASATKRVSLSETKKAWDIDGDGK